jgi:hypothetical protein
MPDCVPLPARYRGVWMRTLLQTPGLRDESSFVRWMQLGRWHADLRIPQGARCGPAACTTLPYSERQRALLVRQQGFCGVTRLEADAQGEVCTWHRVADYQPPGDSPDAARMIFETPDRLIETGVHGVYREIWQRLPQSGGRYIALAEPERADGQASARLFLAGRYLMRVRPVQPAWQPEFEISFGVLDAGQWRIEQSTRPELEGQCTTLSIRLQDMNLAQVEAAWAGTSAWQVLEWAALDKDPA